MGSTSAQEAEELEAPRRFHRLGTRLILATLAALALGHTLSSVHTLWTEQHSIAEQIDARGESLASVGAAGCVEYVLGSDYPMLQTFVENVARGRTDIVFAKVRRPDGALLCEAVNKTRERVGTSAVKQYTAPIHAPGEDEGPGKLLGTIVLGISTESLDELEARRTQELIVSSSASFLLIAGILAFLLRNSLSRPISQLDEHALRLGRGDLDTPIVLESSDEFGRLAWTLDEMRQSLRSSYNELRERNEELRRVGAVRDQALSDLERALDQAREASRAKTEFLATMSHELRTPMNGVIGNASLLLGMELTREQREFMELLRGSAESLRTIVDEILDFSNLDSGRTVLHLADVDLETVVRDAASAAQATARKKGLEFHVYVDADVPRRLRTDALRVRQALHHLLDNAVKFTREGSVMLKVSLDGDAHDRTRLRFAVIDTGIGVTREQRERIFEPFTQADGSNAREHGGTGLGLAICRRIVALLDGEIGCQSEPGSGSLFWFTITVEDVPSRRLDGVQAPLPAPTPQGTRVLLVEDNPVNQRMARHMLTRNGCDVDLAENGLVAVEKAASGEYDLVLMDCSMPVMDGFEATRRIRAGEVGTGRRVPIVALTANAMPGDRENCIEAGMDEYLAKPVTIEQLTAMIAAVAGRAANSD